MQTGAGFTRPPLSPGYILSAPHIEALYRQAVENYRRGNLTLATGLCLSILSADPESYSANSLLGAIRFQEGQLDDALALFGKALKVRPDAVDALVNQARVLDALERRPEALNSYDNALKLDAGHAKAQLGRGMVLLRLGQFGLASACFENCLTRQPDHPDAVLALGAAYGGLGRSADALASCDRALALRSGWPEALNQRCVALRALGRFEDALYCLEMLATAGDVNALHNRATILLEMDRPKGALESLDAAIAREPQNSDRWYLRGNALRALGRREEAAGSYERAIAIDPGHEQAHYNLGATLCEMRRLESGFAAYTRWAGRRASQAGQALQLEGGARLQGPAISPARDEVVAQWREARPQVVVIDDFLSPAALAGLREFCRRSKIWNKHYDNYDGAFPEHGVACPLLAQIAAEMQAAYPGIFHELPLLYLWGFRYGNAGRGIRVHADFAAINVNFWITPDEANLDPASGGLVVWDVPAPADWDFAKYNGEPSAIREFLAARQARPATIPYRANRAVIFDSDLFHETDRIAFREGADDRRINITLLYGRRGQV